jgi:hypothetical protein
MDTRVRNIAGEIGRLEAALRREWDALLRAPDHGRRQALRRNLAVAHEELGALYRRLHALDAAGATADTLLYVVDVAARDEARGGA